MLNNMLSDQYTIVYTIWSFSKTSKVRVRET